jgi:virulence-associated protein VagC
MAITKVFQSGNGQAVQLPLGFEFSSSEVSVRREGEAIILEPVKLTSWPEHFFERIRIEDPAFTRPPHGFMPPAPDFESS